VLDGSPSILLRFDADFNIIDNLTFPSAHDSTFIINFNPNNGRIYVDGNEPYVFELTQDGFVAGPTPAPYTTAAANNAVSEGSSRTLTTNQAVGVGVGVGVFAIVVIVIVVVLLTRKGDGDAPAATAAAASASEPTKPATTV